MRPISDGTRERMGDRDASALDRMTGSVRDDHAEVIELHAARLRRRDRLDDYTPAADLWWTPPEAA